ncbi:hypothetical protein NDU88_004958 [Pleurodeles waltl]|uniref:Uncharacterized protein n=1 Tax=Pleurodeles waltl TaxID=8319 RepID=A0AAV7M955_PLEWA|nr:hypothetical protein NDU88_004958 [Pleurodeles waltl]
MRPHLPLSLGAAPGAFSIIRRHSLQFRRPLRSPLHPLSILLPRRRFSTYELHTAPPLILETKKDWILRPSVPGHTRQRQLMLPPRTGRR